MKHILEMLYIGELCIIFSVLSKKLESKHRKSKRVISKGLLLADYIFSAILSFGIATGVYGVCLFWLDMLEYRFIIGAVLGIVIGAGGYRFLWKKTERMT